jgi:hypothetical protein
MSRVLLEKLSVSQLVKKILAFHWSRRYMPCLQEQEMPSTFYYSCGGTRPNPLILKPQMYQSRMIDERMENWWNVNWQQKTLPQYHSVPHNSHMACPWIKPGPARWEAGDYNKIGVYKNLRFSTAFWSWQRQSFSLLHSVQPYSAAHPVDAGGKAAEVKNGGAIPPFSHMYSWRSHCI